MRALFLKPGQTEPAPDEWGSISAWAWGMSRAIDYLETRKEVDAKRIGFYGLSYGGKTALRIPALLDGYALSICSGDFNEWIVKLTTVDAPYTYMFTPEYEIGEFEANLARGGQTPSLQATKSGLLLMAE